MDRVKVTFKTMKVPERKTAKDILALNLKENFERLLKGSELHGRNKSVPHRRGNNTICKTYADPESGFDEASHNEHRNSIEAEEGKLQKIIIQQYQRICDSNEPETEKPPALSRNAYMSPQNIRTERLPDIYKINKDKLNRQRKKRGPIVKKCNLLLEVNGSHFLPRVPQNLPLPTIDLPASPYTAKRHMLLPQHGSCRRKHMLSQASPQEKILSRFLVETIKEIRSHKIPTENPVLRKQEERTRKYRDSPLFVFPGQV